MRKDWVYIAILSFCGLLFIFLEVVTPAPINWTVTLAHDDKNPFGAYLLDQRLTDLFTEKEVTNQTIYELNDSVENLFILAQNFNPEKEDTKTLLRHVENGQNVFIAANYINGIFSDTLSIRTDDYFFSSDILENITREDTAILSFTNPVLNDNDFFFPRNNSQNYFSRFDSTKTTILAINDLEKPTLIALPYGKGKIFLCSTPLAFTNNYMVFEENHEYIEKSLSYLPKGPITWTEYYQLGRREIQSELRYILSEPALKGAYYVILFSLIAYLLFESKRKQKSIPVIPPLSNDTLDFVGTISNLYYQNNAHKSIALKKINFFKDQLRHQYFLTKKETDDDFYQYLSTKTGKSEKSIKELFELINTIKAKASISKDQLMDLNKKIEAFNHK